MPFAYPFCIGLFGAPLRDHSPQIRADDFGGVSYVLLPREHRVGPKAHGACMPMAHITKGPGTFLGSCALEIQTIGVCYHLIQGERHKGVVCERHGYVLSYKITYKLLRITSTFSERAFEDFASQTQPHKGKWNMVTQNGMILADRPSTTLLC